MIIFHFTLQYRSSFNKFKAQVLIAALFLSVNMGSASAQHWVAQSKLTASDRDSLDFFGQGQGVAISGKYAVVGASFEDDSTIKGHTSREGAAYIFELNNKGQWQEVQKLMASDRQSGDEFGHSVSISGSYVIIGALRGDEDSLGLDSKEDAGAAYIFEKDTNGYWGEVQKLVASDRDSMDQFGQAVAISGNYAIVGAFKEGEKNGFPHVTDEAGAAYIFERDINGNWFEVQKITASDRQRLDLFGSSISLSGNTAVISSPHQDNDTSGTANLNNAGAAYIFERSSNGQWLQKQKLVASDRSAGDEFGSSVAISNKTAIVGAFFDAHDNTGQNPKSFAGSAYIFQQDNNGEWLQIQKIVSSDREDGDVFGFSVAVTEGFAVVGATGEDHDTSGGGTMNFAGSAYIFQQDSINGWHQVKKIVAYDRAPFDNFGAAVAISSNYIFSTAPAEDEDAAGLNFRPSAGSAYIYNACTTSYYAFTPPTSCSPYPAPSGKYIWTTSGIYYDTLSNSSGCDSILTINLLIDSIDVSVVRYSSKIVANSNSGLYQWIYCDSIAIPGETDQTFIPNVNGNYAVIVYKNGCTDTSECQIVNNISVKENVYNFSIDIFPNPTNGHFTINLDEWFEDIHVVIRNASGQEVKSKTYSSGKILDLVYNGPPGVYSVTIHTNDGQASFGKFVKQ